MYKVQSKNFWTSTPGLKQFVVLVSTAMTGNICQWCISITSDKVSGAQVLMLRAFC